MWPRLPRNSLPSPEMRRSAEPARSKARRLSAGVWASSLAGADCVLARLDLGLTRYQLALDRLQAVTTGRARHAHLVRYACPDHVEAAVRADGLSLRRARWPVHGRATAIKQPWATAVAARCAALAAADANAEPLYRQALAAHDGTSARSSRRAPS